MSIKGILFIKAVKANMVSIQTETRLFDPLTCFNSKKKRESRHSEYFFIKFKYNNKTFFGFFSFFLLQEPKEIARKKVQYLTEIDASYSFITIAFYM